MLFPPNVLSTLYEGICLLIELVAVMLVLSQPCWGIQVLTAGLTAKHHGEYNILG
jgi:hypothetical protein